MSIPIIFFHYGNPNYLKYSLKQAKHFNPNSTIYLLGDDKNNHFPFVEHVPISKYSSAGTGFTGIYCHRSSNDENYELNCFLRWFYVQAFCKEYGIEHFFYLDSDVLLFQDLSAIVPLLPPCKIANTGSHTGVPALTYFSDFGAITDFCEHLTWSFSDQAAIAALDQWYQPFRENPQMMGGISDMELFHTYFQRHPQETIKIDWIGDELAVDTNINCSDGYEMENGTKKLYWQNNLPYGKYEATGKLVRFISLHYQGDAKKLMAQHYKASGYTFARFWEPLEVKARFKKIRRAVKGIFKKKK